MNQKWRDIFSKETLYGMVKSLTSWFAALLIVWPQIASDVGTVLADLIGTDDASTAIRIIGVIVLALRAKTDRSLSEKGAPTEKVSA